MKYISKGIIIAVIIIALVLLTGEKTMGMTDNFDPDGNYIDPTFGLPTGGVNSGKVMLGGEGGDWSGSMGRALWFGKTANEFLGRSTISSQKRSQVLTQSNNISDHYYGSLSAYAIDIATSGQEGDEVLAHLMMKFGSPEYKGGEWFNKTINGYRYQIGWKTPSHYDHIHVGVRKV